MKRSGALPSTTRSKKQRGGSPPSSLLQLFRKSYGETAAEDKYGAVFHLVKEKAEEDIRRVLYPGCFVHITPSMFFPQVVYVDSFKGQKDSVKRFYETKDVADELVRIPGKCPEHQLTFHQVDYRSDFGEKKCSFDLVISLNCGTVSTACLKYLKSGGVFLVHNDHGDASLASTDPELELRSVVYHDVDGKLKWESREAVLRKYFKLKKTGQPITREQAIANTKIGRSKWKFRLSNDLEVFFYLFRKIKVR